MLETPDAALDSLIEAVARRDLTSTLKALWRGHDPAVVGSEVGETARGRDVIEAFFARIYAYPGSFRFEFPERSWAFHGEVAWLVADGTVVEPEEARPKPYRLTAVFVRNEQAWLLALWSGAEPVQRG